MRADAEAVGLSLSGYARSRLMGETTPGTRARPARDAAELARLLGQLGKIGGNLNQLARLGNEGRIVPPSDLADCQAKVRKVAAQIAEALNSDR